MSFCRLTKGFPRKFALLCVRVVINKRFCCCCCFLFLFLTLLCLKTQSKRERGRERNETVAYFPALTHRLHNSVLKTQSSKRHRKQNETLTYFPHTNPLLCFTCRQRKATARRRRLHHWSSAQRHPARIHPPEDIPHGRQERHPGKVVQNHRRVVTQIHGRCIREWRDEIKIQCKGKSARHWRQQNCSRFVNVDNIQRRVCVLAKRTTTTTTTKWAKQWS